MNPIPSLVRLEVTDAIATLTLNRPHMHNALVPELLEDFLAALRQVHTRADIRVLILAAESPSFSIGGDMRRFAAEAQPGAEHLRAYSAHLVERLNQAVLALIQLPQPVIAAVHGTITGGSLGFLLGADLAVMAEKTVLKAHYATAGFCPDGGWTARLADLIGTRRTAAALLLNRSISATEALDWGLVSEVAPAAEVLSRARAMATRIAAYPTGTMKVTKRLLNAQAPELAARLEAERQGFLELVSSEEALAGVRQFLATFTSYPGA